MLRCGAKYEKAQNNYYTDSHESPTTKMDVKQRYIPNQYKYAIRMPVWVKVPYSHSTKAALENRRNIIAANELQTDPLCQLTQPTLDNPDPLVKIHVDFLADHYYVEYRLNMLKQHKRPGEYFFDTPPPWTNLRCCCTRIHTEQTCKCCFPVYHAGQDEAIFKQNALPAFYWSIESKQKLRPKTEGTLLSCYCTCRSYLT